MGTFVNYYAIIFMVKNMKFNPKDLNIEIKEANTFFKRLIGLSFRRKITYGMVFKTNAIQTFTMFTSIDVIMTDKEHNIIYKKKGLKPFRIILPKKGVYYTYELTADSTVY